jgi:hypothetical protein
MKIENKLCTSDYVRIKEAISDGFVDRLELLKEIDLGFLKLSPLIVSASDEGYSVSTSIFLDDPIGNTLCF